jgi:hypothetical protein
MTRMTVEQVKLLKDFDYKYTVVERIGHEKAAFYFASHEYDAYQKEIASAQAAGVLVSYGARFMKAR